MLLIILSFFSFYEIAEDYAANGWLSSMDRNTAEFFRQLITPTLTRVVRVVTFFGSVGAVTTASVIAGIILIRKRAFYRVSALALAVGGGRVLAIALKDVFERARPAPENAIVTYGSYSFPSGHTMGTTLLCGSLVIIAATSVDGFGKRAGFFLLGAVWVVVIGATRIYLGAHYLTDVIGGFTAGVAWLAVCWAGVETARRWRRRHDSFPLSR
jgi:undecaprenyl-diphosphatase